MRDIQPVNRRLRVPLCDCCRAPLRIDTSCPGCERVAEVERINAEDRERLAWEAQKAARFRGNRMAPSWTTFGPSKPRSER